MGRGGPAQPELVMISEGDDGLEEHGWWVLEARGLGLCGADAVCMYVCTHL